MISSWEWFGGRAFLGSDSILAESKVSETWRHPKHVQHIDVILSAIGLDLLDFSLGNQGSSTEPTKS